MGSSLVLESSFTASGLSDKFEFRVQSYLLQKICDGSSHGSQSPKPQAKTITSTTRTTRRRLDMAARTFPLVGSADQIAYIEPSVVSCNFSHLRDGKVA